MKNNRFKNVHRTHLSVLIAACLGLVVGASTTSAAQVCDNEYGTILSKINLKNAEKFGSQPRLPPIWSEGRNMLALKALYEKRERIDALQAMQQHIDILVEETSTKNGIVDEVRGRTVDAWGSAKIDYLCGVYSAHVAHTGYLTTPIAWYVYTVLKNPIRYHSTSEQRRKVNTYLDAVAKAVDLHKDEFIIDGDAGYYEQTQQAVQIVNPRCDKLGLASKKISHEPLPYNQMLTLGRTHIYLGEIYELLGNTHLANKHRNIAIRLAKFYHSALVNKDGAYSWDYKLGGRDEDFGHAPINVQFVYDAFKFGLYFSSDDMKKFANSFLVATENPNNVNSHIFYNSNTYWERWQRGAVDWVDLATVEPEVYTRARNIYHNHEGDTITGRALLYKWKPNDNYYFPTNAENLSKSLFSYKPMASVTLSGSTGLYRSPQMRYERLDGKAVTSCVKYSFGKNSPSSTPLRIRYRHTKTNINGDSCGGSACGNPPGALVFSRNDSSESWKFSNSLGVGSLTPEHYKNESIVPANTYNELAVCRSGSGHARDNLQVNYLTQVKNQCLNDCEDGITHEKVFNYSLSGGWKTTSSLCHGYQHEFTNTRSLSGSKVLRLYESSSANHSCNPSKTAGLEMAVYKDIAMTGDSLRVSGWVRAQSRYAGGSSVNNYCVAALDGGTGKLLTRQCEVFKGVKDSDWSHFDYDFSQYVTNSSNIKIAIGSFDSWKANWGQSLQVNNIRVHQDKVCP